MDQRALLAIACWVTGAPALAAPGDLDPTFGNNGLVLLDVARVSAAAATAFAQPDGKLLIGRTGNLVADDFSVIRLNSDGTMDSSFGFVGRTTIDYPRATAQTFAVIAQADGNIAVAGTFAADGAATRELALARLLSDGRLDTSFGRSGVAHADFSDLSRVASARANAVVQQSDGKLVAAGTALYRLSSNQGGDFTAPQMVLARFDTGGVLDTAFGTAGRVVLVAAAGGTGEVRWLTQQPDGKLVAAGFIGSDMAVVRLTAHGVFDASFGTDGIVTFSAGATASAEAVAVQTDGRIVVAGTAELSCELTDPACAGSADAVVARFNLNGSLDTSFGSGGTVRLDAAGTRTKVSTGGLVIDPSGAIVIGGDTAEVGGPRYGFLARLTASGALDASFGDDGATLIDVGRRSDRPDAAMRGIARLADGSIAAALTSRSEWDVDTIVVARAAAAGGSSGVIGFEQPALRVTEGADATFVVRRTGGTAGEVGVSFTTYSLYWDSASPAGVEDYVAASGTLTWRDGDTTERTIIIPTVADAGFEEDEDFVIDLSNPSGGATLAARYGYAIILDNNPSPGSLQIGAASGLFARETDSATFVITRTAGRRGAVSVRYSATSNSATAGIDFAPTTGTLHWADGDNGNKIVRVPIVNDGVTEAGETFWLTLSEPAGGATLGPAFEAQMLIVDPIAASNPGSRGGGGTAALLDLVLLGLALLSRRAARVRKRS